MPPGKATAIFSKITSSRVKIGIAGRVWLFGLATLGVGLFIGFATISVWRHIGTLRTSFNRTQSQSFDIASHFERGFLGLNSHLLRYQLNGASVEWDGFLQEWSRLNEWIDEQRGALRSEAEQKVLGQIDQAFDVYHDAAFRLHTNYVYPLVELENCQEESDHLIRLGYDLARAHQGTLQTFYAGTNHSIEKLRLLLLTAFGMMILLSIGLWAVVYRDMILPLHAKLIESRALLERQEKLASLGVLSAGLAHEIRNPLTAMKARLFTLGKRLEPGTVQDNDAKVISREVDRLERILRDFLEFARPSEPKFTAVGAWDFLREVRGLVLPQFEQQRTRLLLEPSANPMISIDPQQMTQVMLNLVRNAAESMNMQGAVSLRVRTDSVLLRGHHSHVAVLEVSDTGKGIPPEVEKRLFDPFHTTKDGGTGLGLSIAGRIVERHGGALRYKTRVGHGTTFGVVLPIASKHEPGL